MLVRNPMKTVTVTTLFAQLCVAVLAVATLSVDANVTSASANCPRQITHWGRMGDTQTDARQRAYAGMDWKMRTRLGDTVQVVRGIRIEQCKRRNSYLWQCQTSAVVNTCF
ncbi:MAG: hypothetical protein ACR2PG_07340 [Hyphomicrobiaceae bacterium]